MFLEKNALMVKVLPGKSERMAELRGRRPRVLILFTK